MRENWGPDALFKGARVRTQLTHTFRMDFGNQLDLSPDETLGGMMGASLSGAERDGRAFINGFPDFAEVPFRFREEGGVVV